MKLHADIMLKKLFKKKYCLMLVSIVKHQDKRLILLDIWLKNYSMVSSVKLIKMIEITMGRKDSI